jgi:hypothetical protein
MQNNPVKKQTIALKKTVLSILTAALLVSTVNVNAQSVSKTPIPLAQLQQQFVDLRFRDVYSLQYPNVS